MQRQLFTLVIADDDEVFRYALVRSLEPSFAVVAAVGDGLAAVHAVQTHEPDIVLLDVSMPGMDGLQAANRIATDRPRVKIIILSSYSDTVYVAAAFERGALGYVLKGDFSEILRALNTVLSGGLYKPAIVPPSGRTL